MKYLDYLQSFVLGSGGEGGGGGGGLIPVPEGYTQYETQKGQGSTNWIIGRQTIVNVEQAMADQWSVGNKICLKAPYQISGVTQGNGAVWGTVASKGTASSGYVQVYITVAGSFVTPTVTDTQTTPMAITENKTGYIFGAGKYKTNVPSTVELYTDRTFATIPSVNTRWNPYTQMTPSLIPAVDRGYVCVGTYNGDNYVICGVGVSYSGTAMIMVRGVTKIEGGDAGLIPAPDGYTQYTSETKLSYSVISALRINQVSSYFDVDSAIAEAVAVDDKICITAPYAATSTATTVLGTIVLWGAVNYKSGTLIRLTVAGMVLNPAQTVTGPTLTSNDRYYVFGSNIAEVNVPNSYTAEDIGKVVVSTSALQAQTSREITENGTYDTTSNNEVVVNVAGGGGGSGLQTDYPMFDATYTEMPQANVMFQLTTTTELDLDTLQAQSAVYFYGKYGSSVRIIRCPGNSIQPMGGLNYLVTPNKVFQ